MDKYGTTVVQPTFNGAALNYVGSPKDLKLFQCFISHAITPETETKVFQPLKEFWNYFKIISATQNMLEHIHELQQSSEKILKLLQASVHALN